MSTKNEFREKRSKEVLLKWKPPGGRPKKRPFPRKLPNPDVRRGFPGGHKFRSPETRAERSFDAALGHEQKSQRIYRQRDVRHSQETFFLDREKKVESSNIAAIQNPEVFKAKLITFSGDLEPVFKSNMAVSNEKMAISNEKLTVSNEKMAVPYEKMAGLSEKLAALNKKMSDPNHKKAVLNEKLMESDEKIAVPSENVVVSDEKLVNSDGKVVISDQKPVVSNKKKVEERALKIRDIRPDLRVNVIECLKDQNNIVIQGKT